MKNTETQIVAKEFNARIVSKFSKRLICFNPFKTCICVPATHGWYSMRIIHASDELTTYILLLKTSHGILLFLSFGWFTGHGI